jgi:hypothetical protein
MILVAILNRIIIPYSLKNKKINVVLLISILNPLISSLSPSRRSNGARLVSIKIISIQQMSQVRSISLVPVISDLRRNLLLIVMMVMNLRIIVTSKESLWSIPRILPNLEKPLVLLHPVRITA